MLAWSPLLIQKIEIAALGFGLRKLQLNRHRAAEVGAHGHGYAQVILYLAGEGVQHIRGKSQAARAGDQFMIPPGVEHGFSPVGASRPLCLVLDYETKRPARRVVHRHLPQQALNELHALLARIPTKGRPRLADCPTILSVIAWLLDPPPASGDGAPEPALASLVDKVRADLKRGRSLAAIAKEAGYVRDALSRRLKREHGFGLRGLRDQERLQQAQTALRAGPEIAAAAAAGFDDPNYFTRWFRRQTGKTPTAWRRPC